MQQWTNEEDIVLLYFTTRGAIKKTCSDLIFHKCLTVRSHSSVKGRLEHLRWKHPDWYTDRKWVLHEVDAWIAQQPEYISMLVEFESHEERIVEQVSAHKRRRRNMTDAVGSTRMRFWLKRILRPGPLQRRVVVER